MHLQQSFGSLGSVQQSTGTGSGEQVRAKRRRVRGQFNFSPAARAAVDQNSALGVYNDANNASHGQRCSVGQGGAWTTHKFGWVDHNAVGDTNNCLT